MILGLTGRMGAGKDTVCERLQMLLENTAVQRKSFADPLKDSVCALLKIDRAELEELKSDGLFIVAGARNGAALNMREFLQRYGTEAHRSVFGDDFWLDATLPFTFDDVASELTVVTDCRFPNEAERVRKLGGMVYEVVGPGGKMRRDAEHASERALPLQLLDGYIFNVVRDDGYRDLDNTLRYQIIPDLLGRR